MVVSGCRARGMRPFCRDEPTDVGQVCLPRGLDQAEVFQTGGRINKLIGGNSMVIVLLSA